MNADASLGGTLLSARLWKAKGSVVPRALPLLFPTLTLGSTERSPCLCTGGIRSLMDPGHVPGGRGWLGAVFLYPHGLSEGLTTWLINHRWLPLSLQFLPPKKESACEKRGLSGPGVTAASPAPLPARVRRRHFLLLSPPHLFPGPRAGVVGRRSRRGGPLGSPYFPLTAPPSPSLVPSTH